MLELNLFERLHLESILKEFNNIFSSDNQNNHSIIDLSKEIKNRFEKEKKLNIHKMAEELKKEFEPLLDQHNLELNIENLKGTEIKTRPQTIKTILTDLLTNHIKYARPEGTRTTNKKIIDWNAKLDKNHIRFTFKDEGIGIPKEEWDQIWKRGGRASNQKRKDSTGIGFANVKNRLTTLLDGDINIIHSSTLEPSGTTFEMLLPNKVNN